MAIKSKGGRPRPKLSEGQYVNIVKGAYEYNQAKVVKVHAKMVTVEIPNFGIKRISQASVEGLASKESRPFVAAEDAVASNRSQDVVAANDDESPDMDTNEVDDFPPQVEREHPEDQGKTVTIKTTVTSPPVRDQDENAVARSGPAAGEVVSANDDEDSGVEIRGTVDFLKRDHHKVQSDTLAMKTETTPPLREQDESAVATSEVVSENEDEDPGVDMKEIDDFLLRLEREHHEDQANIHALKTAVMIPPTNIREQEERAIAHIGPTRGVILGVHSGVDALEDQGDTLALKQTVIHQPVIDDDSKHPEQDYKRSKTSQLHDKDTSKKRSRDIDPEGASSPDKSSHEPEGTQPKKRKLEKNVSPEQPPSSTVPALREEGPTVPSQDVPSIQPPIKGRMDGGKSKRSRSEKTERGGKAKRFKSSTTEPAIEESTKIEPPPKTAKETLAEAEKQFKAKMEKLKDRYKQKRKAAHIMNQERLADAKKKFDEESALNNDKASIKALKRTYKKKCNASHDKHTAHLEELKENFDRKCKKEQRRLQKVQKKVKETALETTMS